MKSLKLKKVKISRIGNPHILLGGATNGVCTTLPPPPPPVTLDEECMNSIRNPEECPTNTNTTGTRTIDPGGIETVGCGIGG
ncbi:hypothetical protein KORDIASMS9_00813 [Kordia sp. SMS9]|uniref:hypothetical protein n=1 Tax=Kordia sp. SMS9 TaxID=2282170 RepID=UPI000E0DE7B8|nr:hypothetical protein [Kordia sp. SMS9]AXG68598.1 hypothetical protein KORDIASMS9_00813 [Kordia sp. SMS9]